ncbi:hypothetical protein [Microvirga vignae]|uniref:hypothetical protein n=1 Tax=Microvirga vignae TaxID=1225564 RepID=UPI001FCE2B09|nr:hypothetical protein [Microvirga vignae]
MTSRRASRAFCARRWIAHQYAAFVGIRYDGDYETASSANKQRKFLKNLQQARPLVLPWLTGFADPSSATQMSAAIDLLKDKARLLTRLFNLAAVRLVERATDAHSLRPDLRSVVLDRPHQIAPQRRDLLAAYCRLRQRSAHLYPDAFGGKPPFSVTTFDPSVLPEIKAIVANTNGRFFVIDNPDKEEQLRPSLAEGLIKSSVVAVGPKGSSEQWIRQKAGFGRHDDAARAREQSFKGHLQELADGPLSKDQSLAITLSRTEYLEIAAATPGKELVRALPSAVMNLMLLLGEHNGMPLPGEQVEVIQQSIQKKPAGDCRSIFSAPTLCALRSKAGAGAEESSEGTGDSRDIQEEPGCLPAIPKSIVSGIMNSVIVSETELPALGPFSSCDMPRVISRRLCSHQRSFQWQKQQRRKPRPARPQLPRPQQRRPPPRRLPRQLPRSPLRRLLPRPRRKLP